MSNRVMISSNDRDEFSNVLETRYTRALLEAMTDPELRQADRVLNRHIRQYRGKSRSTKEYEIEDCYTSFAWMPLTWLVGYVCMAKEDSQEALIDNMFWTLLARMKADGLLPVAGSG